MEDHQQGSKKPQQPEARNDEFGQQEQEKISGGRGEIKGESLDDKRKDW
jgi:hypothetical protein